MNDTKLPIVIDNETNQAERAADLNYTYGKGITQCRISMDIAVDAANEEIKKAGNDTSAKMAAVAESINSIKQIAQAAFQFKKEYCKLNLLPNSLVELETVIEKRKLTKIKELEAGSKGDGPSGAPAKGSIADK